MIKHLALKASSSRSCSVIKQRINGKAKLKINNNDWLLEISCIILIAVITMLANSIAIIRITKVLCYHS
jgi:hypothetical protein